MDVAFSIFVYITYDNIEFNFKLTDVIRKEKKRIRLRVMQDEVGGNEAAQWDSWSFSGFVSLVPCQERQWLLCIACTPHTATTSHSHQHESCGKLTGYCTASMLYWRNSASGKTRDGSQDRQVKHRASLRLGSLHVCYSADTEKSALWSGLPWKHSHSRARTPKKSGTYQKFFFCGDAT
jgi:hypothetical protein